MYERPVVAVHRAVYIMHVSVASPRVQPPGTEEHLLGLSGNFIPGVAGIDSLLTIYGLHLRTDPGDLFGQRLNL